ncbi:MAG: hypothetical protein ACLUNZ_05200 [Evtepia sp.]
MLPVPFFPSKDAFPYYPITVSPGRKAGHFHEPRPRRDWHFLYRYNVDTYQTTLLLPGDPADTAYPMGWLDDSTLLVARRSGYVALTLDSQLTSLPFACTDPQVATVQDGLVVYVDGDAKTQTTLYVGRYADGALTSILEEPNVIPHLTDAPLISPNQTKLAVLCETDAGPLEYRIYDLGHRRLHRPPRPGGRHPDFRPLAGQQHPAAHHGASRGLCSLACQSLRRCLYVSLADHVFDRFHCGRRCDGPASFPQESAKMDHLPALGRGAAADGLPRRGFPPREPDAGDGFQRCVCRAGFAPGRNTCKHRRKRLPQRPQHQPPSQHKLP